MSSVWGCYLLQCKDSNKDTKQPKKPEQAHWESPETVNVPHCVFLLQTDECVIDLVIKCTFFFFSFQQHFTRPCWDFCTSTDLLQPSLWQQTRTVFNEMSKHFPVENEIFFRRREDHLTITNKALSTVLSQHRIEYWNVKFQHVYGLQKRRHLFFCCYCCFGPCDLCFNL